MLIDLPDVLRERCLRWTPHPVIVTIRDNKDYIKVLLYSYYTTITGWGVLLRDAPSRMYCSAQPRFRVLGSMGSCLPGGAVEKAGR